MNDGKNLYPNIATHFLNLLISEREGEEITDAVFSELAGAPQGIIVPIRQQVTETEDKSIHQKWINRLIKTENPGPAAFAARMTSTGIIRNCAESYEILKRIFQNTDHRNHDKAWICAGIFYFDQYADDSGFWKEIFSYYEKTKPLQTELTIQNFGSEGAAVSALLEKLTKTENRDKQWAYCWFIHSILENGYDLSDSQVQILPSVLENREYIADHHQGEIASFLGSFFGALEKISKAT